MDNLTHQLAEALRILYMRSSHPSGVKWESARQASCALALYKNATKSESAITWVCNGCDSEEFTGAFSESDFENDAQSCTGCGGTEFHKVQIAAISRAPGSKVGTIKKF